MLLIGTFVIIGGGRLIRYRVIKETLWMEYVGSFTAYGIVAEKQQGAEWMPVAYVGDVTLSPHEAQALADLCQQVELEPIHLADIVEDFRQR